MDKSQRESMRCWLVCGDRNWDNYTRLRTVLDRLQVANGPIDVIIEGEANGADILSKHYGMVKKIPVLAVPAQWEKYGKAAGMVRNTLMLSFGPEFIIAFHDEIKKSKGTANMILQGLKKGVKVCLVTATNVKWLNADWRPYMEASTD